MVWSIRLCPRSSRKGAEARLDCIAETFMHQYVQWLIARPPSVVPLLQGWKLHPPDLF